MEDQRVLNIEQKQAKSRKTKFGIMYHGDKGNSRRPRDDRYKDRRKVRRIVGMILRQDLSKFGT